MVAVTQLVAILLYLVMPMQSGRVRRRPLDLTPNRAGGPMACTRDNKPGLCVHESACNEEHTIMPGGVVEDSDFREKKQCPAQADWCCTSGEVPHPQIGTAQSDKCLALQSDECPWCVLLYNVVDVKPTSNSPFCLGALIGSRVILTASTCLKSAQKKMLYVQVPNSADPGKNYTVIRRQFHPEYNSGSHQYDFGIMVLDNDVTFVNSKSRGACINYETPSGECVGYGFDYKGRITSTILTVKNGSCGKNGNSVDAICGSMSDNICIVAEGGPLICRNRNKQGLYLVGIARSICNKADQVTLGDISKSKQWLEEELALLSVPRGIYT